MLVYKKKGQAALEFLTTYGWAFLIIILVIGALSYFGVLRPSKLLPEKCMFGNDFDCVAAVVDGGDGTNGQIRFRLQNKVGLPIYVVSVNASTDLLDSSSFNCSFTATKGLTDRWPDKGFKDFNTTSDCPMDNAQLSQGNKGKVLIKLTYYKAGASNFKHQVDGEIYATVK